MSDDLATTQHVAAVLATLASWRRRHQLTAHQGEVLVQLHAAGAITAAEVCRVIGITTASMTRIVAHLEHDGWVLRVRDDADARRLILQPTKQLARAIDELEHDLETALVAEPAAAPARSIRRKG